MIVLQEKEIAHLTKLTTKMKSNAAHQKTLERQFINLERDIEKIKDGVDNIQEEWVKTVQEMVQGEVKKGLAEVEGVVKKMMNEGKIRLEDIR